MRTIGYVRVSTVEQGDSGAGLEAQREAILVEIERRGWELVRIAEDVASGKALIGRRGLREVLDELDAGKAEALVVAKVDRLSRSLRDFADILEHGRRKRWQLVALDLGVDTSTPSGEMLANTLAVFAQFERRLTGQRTKEALAVKRAQGVRLGRPPVLPVGVRRRIRGLRSRGHSLQAIADRLTDDQVPTAHGGKRWYASTVAKVLHAGRARVPTGR